MIGGYTRLGWVALPKPRFWRFRRWDSGMWSALGFMVGILFCTIFLAGCRTPQPGAPPPAPITPGTVVHCTADAVGKHAIDALPAVNECLKAASGDVTGCLEALIVPAAGITIDTVACVVRAESQAAADREDSSPEAVRVHMRAQAFLAQTGILFAD